MDYERQMQNLKNIMSPNSGSLMSHGGSLLSTPNSVRGSSYNLSAKTEKWTQER
jgi:hypothetical protein